MKYLKVMKGKNLQSRILYLARVSFIFNGEIQSFTDKQKLREFSTTKAKRIQHQKTSFTTNVKGTYTVQKSKKKKNDLQNQAQTIKKMAIETYISIITIYKWIKCSNQMD